jgi:hypothetical protein
VVETFIKSLGIYPVGSFVKLNTGEMGVVTRVNPEDSLRPTVGIIFTRFGKKRPHPFTIDIHKEFRDSGENARSIVGHGDPKEYQINVEDYLDTPA